MAPKKIKISIVIPVYNVAPYIEDCIRSVVSQAWGGNIECVIVDDGCTDNSMQIIDDFLCINNSHVEFNIIHHETNQGLSAARNTGINAATGDYIYFLDGDDEITPSCIADMVQPLENEYYDIVVGDYRIMGNRQKIPLRMDDCTIIRNAEILSAYRRQDWNMMAVNKFYRMEFLRDRHLLFQRGIIYEDELWSFQIACMAKSLAVVGKITYLYKIRKDSTSMTEFSPAKAESLNIILSEMYRFAIQENLHQNIDIHNIIQNFRIASLYRVMKEIPELLDKHYTQQRKNVRMSWWGCFCLNKTDWRKQIRDFHLALPVFLALPYLRRMLHSY